MAISISSLYSQHPPPLPLLKDWQREKDMPSPTLGPQIHVLKEQCYKDGDMNYLNELVFILYCMCRLDTKKI